MTTHFLVGSRSPLVLTEPLLGVRELFDRDIIIPANFKKTPAAHAIDAHPDGIKIRNVSIHFETDTWLPAWSLPFPEQPAVGINSYCDGLWLPAGTKNVDIDGLHVEGSPRWAIEGNNIVNLRMRRFSATRCFGGVFLGEQPQIAYGNRDWEVDQVRIWDTWGPPVGYSSRVRPGGWVGGDCWVSEGDAISLSRFELSGECYVGAKICRGRHVVLRNFETPSLMLQGSSSADPALPGLEMLYAEGLYINAARGYGPGADGANKIQCSWNVEAKIRGGYIIGNTKDGNAIQATGNVRLDVRGMTIGGFNGFRGIGNPAHALELDERPPVSTINADFETANTFVNQERILRRAK